MQITGNDTKLGFFNYFCTHNRRPSIVFLALWIQCCWPWVVCQFFVCPRNILMIKCRPVYLFNFFSVENPCLVMPRGNGIIIPYSIWWAGSCFYGERRVLWYQVIQVSSTGRFFFWSSVIFVQPLDSSQNPKSSQFF